MDICGLTTYYIGNIGVYHPYVFRVKSGFTSYLFTIFHMGMKVGILGVESRNR